MARLKWLIMSLIIVLAACSGSSSIHLASKTLLPDFLDSAAPRIQEAYQFAIVNQHELTKYPCYCGCVYMGHTSNLECYIDVKNSTNGTLKFDQHAAGCGICVDITHDVMSLLEEGKTSPEIRTYIDATYSKFGPGTDTPLPTE